MHYFATETNRFLKMQFLHIMGAMHTATGNHSNFSHGSQMNRGNSLPTPALSPLFSWALSYTMTVIVRLYNLKTNKLCHTQVKLSIYMMTLPQTLLSSQYTQGISTKVCFFVLKK